MKRLNVMKRVLTSIFTVFFAVSLSHAQTNQGQIAGNVTDASGAAVAGASVTAKSAESGSVYTTRSTSAGSYRFPSIQLGSYTVTTAFTGFKQAITQAY